MSQLHVWIILCLPLRWLLWNVPENLVPFLCIGMESLAHHYPDTTVVLEFLIAELAVQKHGKIGVHQSSPET